MSDWIEFTVVPFWGTDLEKIKQYFEQLGFTVHVLKRIQFLGCGGPVESFEKVFQTTIKRESRTVPNLNGPSRVATNYVPTSPVQISQEQKDLGIEMVQISQPIVLTD